MHFQAQGIGLGSNPFWGAGRRTHSLILEFKAYVSFDHCESEG